MSRSIVYISIYKFKKVKQAMGKKTSDIFGQIKTNFLLTAQTCPKFQLQFNKKKKNDKGAVG